MIQLPSHHQPHWHGRYKFLRNEDEIHRKLLDLKDNHERQIRDLQERHQQELRQATINLSGSCRALQEFLRTEIFKCRQQIAVEKQIAMDEYKFLATLIIFLAKEQGFEDSSLLSFLQYLKEHGCSDLVIKYLKANKKFAYWWTTMGMKGELSSQDPATSQAEDAGCNDESTPKASAEEVWDDTETRPFKAIWEAWKKNLTRPPSKLDHGTAHSLRFRYSTREIV